MEHDHFQREIQKYKIVRLEDYYRPRNKRVEKNTATIKNESSNDHVSTGGKGKHTVVGSASADVTFWQLLETKLAEALTPAELRLFIEEMKKNHLEVLEHINLEDIDSALIV